MFQFKNKYSNAVFKDKKLQEQLEENGFVIVPFYSDEDIKNLHQFYTKNTTSNNNGFQPTTYVESLEYRLQASTFIKNIAQKYLDYYLENYKTFMGSYIVKHNDKNSELGVHQDMTLVDESKFMGINTWIPLCDTNEKNGALYVIPKSHRIFPTYRNATIPNIYDKYYQEIKKYMQPIYMKAGEAIFFDNSIIHFSPINRSDEVRIATNIFLTHQDARITIAYKEKEQNRIELYEQGDDFFTTYTQFGNDSNMLRPQIGQSIGFRDYDFPILTPKVLEEKYGKLKNENIFQKLKEKLFA